MTAARDTDDEVFWRLERWRSIVDEAIDEARERGDFDGLPGHGRPLELRSNPLAGDRELAFHLIENAGVAPPWMDADKAVNAERAALAPLLAPERLPVVPAPPPPWAEISAFPWRLPRPPCWPFRGCRMPAAPPAAPMAAAPRPAAPAASLRGETAARDRARRRYLDQAARLDAAIARRNAALPAELRYLEQPRLTPERAARDFDAAWPLVGGDRSRRA